MLMLHCIFLRAEKLPTSVTWLASYCLRSVLTEQQQTISSMFVSLLFSQQLTFSWLFVKVSIYQESGCMRSKMSSLQQLCSLLPFNPWHWFSLGQTCLQLLECSSATGWSTFLSHWLLFDCKSIHPSIFNTCFFLNSRLFGICSI